MKSLIVLLLASLFTLSAFAGVKPSGPPSTEAVEYWEPPSEKAAAKKAPKAKKETKKAAEAK
jgi:hypothetical protein